MPFIAMAAYLYFASIGWWPLAVASIMMLSFVTYGSSSHDLVHRNLHLPPQLNDLLLSLIEMLSFRSGTAYRLSHLNHHQHLLEKEDIEGAMAHGTFWGSILSGVLLQPRLWIWAWKKHRSKRNRLLIEAVGIATLILSAMTIAAWTLTPLIYAGLVIGGSWLFPLVTVYIPHDARGEGPMKQTRLFRRKIWQLVTFDHLYHLEHHLYPAVPHHHWKKLSQRLDPYFEQLGIRPYDAESKIYSE